MAEEEREQAVLLALNADGAIADSGDFATKHGLDHKLLTGSIRSLASYELITVEVGA